MTTEDDFKQMNTGAIGRNPQANDPQPGYPNFIPTPPAPPQPITPVNGNLVVETLQKTIPYLTGEALSTAQKQLEAYEK